ncbi:hypothetical protein, partial [Streptomyces violaceusniger]|uniref:hypothetical protein n=1 Tax=Streptomyces violaceusniger TaxID=68280 RepID=UPI001BDE06CB
MIDIDKDFSHGNRSPATYEIRKIGGGKRGPDDLPTRQAASDEFALREKDGELLATLALILDDRAR